MTVGYLEERCSCNAKFKAPAMMAGAANLWENAVALLESWRQNHRHEFAPEPDEMPLIHESGSSHERLPEFWDTEDRAPTGFMRNA